MTLTRHAPARRRHPAPVDRYRAVARDAKRRRARPRLPIVLTGLVWGVVLLSAVLVADTAAGGLSRMTGSFGSIVTGAIPAPVPVGDLLAADTTGQVGAAPTLDALPQFTKEPTLLVQGLIPSFGRTADRKVAIRVNGSAATLVPFDTNGRFALALVLADGVNEIDVALVTPTETIATTTQAIVLDRTVPTLAMTKPKDKDTIDGPNVTVEGKTEPGTTILVNDRNVIVGPDGSFSDTVTVPLGALALNVVARDRAGNETKSLLTVTVKAPGTTAASTVIVTLANAKVKPGGFVTANITVLNGATPLAGQTVSLQVGVVTIGAATTNAAGQTTISFFAPPNEGLAQVVVLAGKASGSAALTVAK